MTTRARPATAPGEIDPRCIYTVGELKRRLRWGRVSWRKARRDGLRVLRAGRSRYVRGSDLIDYLEATGKVETVEEVYQQ